MKKGLFILAVAIGLIGCIKDDFVDDFISPQLRITSSIDTLEIGTSFQLEQLFLDNTGSQVTTDVEWESSNTAVLSIDAAGLITAEDFGEATITASTSANGETYTDDIAIVVGENTVITVEERFGNIETTSSYVLTGSFTMTANDTGFSLDFANNYAASTALPGLYVYLSNNPNSIADAYEIGAVETFLGEHSYQISGVNINEFNYLVYFCAPFNVKVGDGTIY